MGLSERLNAADEGRFLPAARAGTGSVGKLGEGEACGRFVFLIMPRTSNLTQCRGLHHSKSLGDSQQMDILQGWRKNTVARALADKPWKNSLRPTS